MAAKWARDSEFAEEDAEEILDAMDRRKDDDTAPPDRWNLVYVIIAILGMGSLYPWTFFTTAADYFRYTFRNTTHPAETTTYQNVFENALTIIATACGVLGMVINSWLTNRISFKTRIYGGFFGILAVFILTTVFTQVDTDAWQGGFFILTMLSVFFINLASNLVGGGLFGVQGCLPAGYATALMVGQALAGFASAFASILSIVATRGDSESGESIKAEGTGYFGSAIGTIVLCLVCFAVMLKLPVFRFYLGITLKKPVTDKSINPSFADESSVEDFTPPPPLLMPVLRKMQTYLLVLFVTMATSLSIFPALCSSVRSTNPTASIFAGDLFTPIACFLMFPCADLAGRLVHGFIRLPRIDQGSYSLVLVVLRVALVPLLFYCNAQPRVHTSAVFGDAVFIVLVALLGFSNGYLISLGVMYAPQLVLPNEGEFAGSLIGVMINCGLFVGSGLSFLIAYFL